jgi:predicted RNA-binding protein
MTFIGQIELTKKKPPKVSGDERAWQDLYDTLNHLIDAVNSKKTTEIRRPGNLQGSIGDLKVFKDKTDGKYYLEAMTEDGSARRELAINDKDVRTGKGYYSTSGIPGEGGTGGSDDTRNIEQQLFEAVPWTNGTPNNVAIDSDGKIVIDDTAGATVSNDNIAETDIVGSGKTFAAGQKPNKTEINSDGELVADGTTTSTVISNGKIVVTDVVGTGKSFTSNPLTAAVAAQSTADSALSTANGKNKSFYQSSVPSSGVKEGDMWFDTGNGNLMYRADSDNSDAITSGKWELVNAIPNLAAISISASNINAGAVTSGKINVSSLSAISADMGSITAGSINIGSGKAELQSGGDAKFSSGAIKFDSNGNVHFQGDASAGGVIYFHAGNDTKNYTDSAFRLHHNESGNVLTINYDGSNRLFLENDGDLRIQGSDFSFGTLSNNDTGFTYSSGHMFINMGDAAYKFKPNRDDKFDLGDTSNRWDDIYATNATIATSDVNLKNTITDSTLGLNFIDSLRPVSYKLNNKSRTHYGLIAQEVKTTLDSLSVNTQDFAGYVDPSVTNDDDNGPLGLRYSEFIAPIIKAIQELKEEVEKLKT